jgi:DnaJ-class molecular chaperone
MKCRICNGLGYIVEARPSVPGKTIAAPPLCENCKGTGIVVDQKPAKFVSRITAARRTRKP